MKIWWLLLIPIAIVLWGIIEIPYACGWLAGKVSRQIRNGYRNGWREN